MLSSIIRGQLVSKSVGNNMRNDEDDVLRVKKALGATGYFDVRTPPEPHGIVTRDMDRAIKRFQTDNDLKIDGIMRPDRETEKSMITALRSSKDSDDKKPAPPTPPRKPEPPKEKEKPRCEQEQVDLINEQGKLKVAEDNLKRAKVEKRALEQKRVQLETLLKKETSVISGDKGKARVIGGAAAAIGSSAIFGPATAGPAFGVGASFGPLVEEGTDLITGQKTDGQIRHEINAIKEDIKRMQEKIETVLKPAIVEARALVEEKRQAFLNCRRS